MDLVPGALLAALAALVRGLGAVSDRVGDRVTDTLPDNVGMVVVGAAGVFAPTAYSRARLARQMYASGLLGGDAPTGPGADRNPESRQPRVLA